MEDGKITWYLSRILSGCLIFEYKDKIYKLVYPNINIKYNAERYAEQEYNKIKYNNWITDSDITNILIGLGLWSSNGDQELKNIENKIEDLKVELFHNFLNPSKIKNIKKSLDNARKTYNLLSNNRHMFDSSTAKGYVEILKNQYIFIHSLYTEDDNKLFDNDNNIDYLLLNNLISTINSHTIDLSTFRKIARSEIWRNYWSANKDNIFGKPTIDWTDEQKTLIIFSKMYDSAADHPDSPPDSVIQDDDMFDGWMIMQRRENEKSKSQNRAEKLLKDKKIGNAQEVFLVANSKEEAQNIYNLNDSNSKHIINERKNTILRSNKDIKESDLPDVQRNLVIQNNQQFIQGRKQK